MLLLPAAQQAAAAVGAIRVAGVALPRLGEEAVAAGLRTLAVAAAGAIAMTASQPAVVSSLNSNLWDSRSSRRLLVIFWAVARGVAVADANFVL